MGGETPLSGERGSRMREEGGKMGIFGTKTTPGPSLTT